MDDKTAETHISETLTGNLRENALQFVMFLRKNDIELIRSGGYWEDTLYWSAMFRGEFVCFFLVGAEEPEQDPNTFVIWSDNNSAGWYENAEIDEYIKETFWQNVDFCGNCGFCGGGTGKSIFSRDFDNVCITTFKFDNPDENAVKCAIKMVELRKNDILGNTDSCNHYSG